MKDLADRLSQWYGSDCLAAVAYWAPWPDQQVFRGTLTDIADKTAASGIKKTAMIIVGKALSLDIPASKLYDPSFTHEYHVGNQP